MYSNHIPLDYRGRFERDSNPYGPPADICSTCSDFENGLLVPVTQCRIAYDHLVEYHSWLEGSGPRPTWLADNLAWEDGPDVFRSRFPAAPEQATLFD